MRKLSMAVLCLVFIAPASVLAVGSGGYENATFGARAIGQANSVVAQADEPAAIAYNPAGIVELPGFQAQTSLALINGWTFAEDTQGSSTVSRGTANLIPLGYMTVNPGEILGRKVAFGIGSDSPFGLSKQYDSNHEIARYTGYDNWLKMYTLRMVMAAEVCDWLTVGAGPVYYRIFDYGGEQWYPNKIIVPGSADGVADVRMSGNSWGWQFGLMLKPHEQHQIGLYFRSPVDVLLKGRIEVKRSAFGPNFKTGAHLKTTLPMNITVGYAYKPNKKTTIETDFGFTRWSVYERSFINPDATGRVFDDMILNAIAKADKDWNEGYAFHLGGNHRFTDRLTGRAGFLFYWTPIPEDHYIPAIPDSNRMAFAFGLGYQLTSNFEVEVAYEGLFNLRRRIDNSISESIGGSVDGEYSTFIQDAVISFTYKWEKLFERFRPSQNADVQTPQISV